MSLHPVSVSLKMHHNCEDIYSARIPKNKYNNIIRANNIPYDAWDKNPIATKKMAIYAIPRISTLRSNWRFSKGLKMSPTTNSIIIVLHSSALVPPCPVPHIWSSPSIPSSTKSQTQFQKRIRWPWVVQNWEPAYTYTLHLQICIPCTRPSHITPFEMQAIQIHGLLILLKNLMRFFSVTIRNGQQATLSSSFTIFTSSIMPYNTTSNPTTMNVAVRFYIVAEGMISKPSQSSTQPLTRILLIWLHQNLKLQLIIDSMLDTLLLESYWWHCLPQ